MILIKKNLHDLALHDIGEQSRSYKALSDMALAAVSD